MFENRTFFGRVELTVMNIMLNKSTTRIKAFRTKKRKNQSQITQLGIAFVHSGSAPE